MNGSVTTMPRVGAGMLRPGQAPASQVLRTQTENTARNLMKTRNLIIEQMATLQGQLADVEASLSAAFDLMTKIDRDGMAARLESERLESETDRERGSGTDA